MKIMQHHFVSAPPAIPFIGTKFPLRTCTPHRFHECKIASCFALAPIRSSVNIESNLKLTGFIFWLWAVLRGSFLFGFSTAIRDKLIFKIPPVLSGSTPRRQYYFQSLKDLVSFIRNDVTLDAPQR
jgi:hypothetical protein